MCPSTLNTVNTASEALVANAFIDFSTNNVCSGCHIKHVAGSTTINLCGEGIYLVEVNVDAVPTVAGLYSIKLVNNGVDVNGAEASVTGAEGSTDNLSFTTLIRVAKPCACNPNMGASLQVQIDAAVTLTNASMTVVKVA